GPSGPANGGGSGGGSNSGAGGGGGGPGGRAGGADAAPGASSGPAAQHQCQGGHPVDLVTGAVVDEAVDFELPGRIPLVFKRFYASARFRDRAATMGPGWHHSFEQDVTVGPKAITLRDQEGRSIWFEPIAVGASTFHRRERLTLHREGDLDFRIVDHKTNHTARFRPLSAGGVAMLQTIDDAWGNQIRFEYDAGQLRTVHDTAGREVHLRWRGGRIVRLEVHVAGSCEVWVDYEYSDAGLLTAAIDALGHATEFEYDGYGRMVAVATKTGARFQYTYDGDTGRCSRTWGPKGIYAIDLEYDLTARQTRLVGEESRVIDWSDLPGYAARESLLDGAVLEESAYDVDGFRIAVVNGASEGTKHWFDARGNEIRRVDSMGRVTAWEIAADRPRRRVDPDGLVTELVHDDKGALVGARHPNGKQVSFEYDDRGRVVHVRDEGGTLRRYEYDAQHNVVGETNALGHTTRYGYDALGRAISQTDALGRTIRVTRDRLGRPLVVRRADGTTVQRTFDPSGRILREVDPAGGVTEVSWIGFGKIGRLVEPDGRTWRFDYTSMERIAKITNPLGESYEYTYDDAGWVAETKSFDDRTLKYHRDGAGRIARIDFPDGSWRSYRYDKASRLVGDDASDGSTVTHRRDLMGRILESVFASAGRTNKTVFERDPYGNILVERQGDRVLRYGYDLDHRTVERVLFDGTTTRYQFDRESDLVAIEHAGHRFGFERDAGGREIRRTDGRGVYSVEHAFDAMDRIIEQRVAAATGPDGVAEVLAQRQYQYDRAGRLTRSDDATWGATTYRYDAVGRLVEEAHADHKRAFTYDPASSLVAILERLGSPAGTSPRWKLAPGNRLVETETHTYVYDKRARRTAKRHKKTGAVTDYVWDARDQLREVKLPDGTHVVMEYDAFGRRIRKEARAAGAQRAKATELVWDRDQICADLTPERGVRVFVSHPNGGTPLLQTEKGETFHVVTDHIGIPRELIDGAGRVAWAAKVDAWGRITDEKWEPIGEQNRGYRVRSPFRLLGQYEDEETGLTVTRYRQFDPEVGRWLSPDPLGVRGGLNLHGFDGTPTVDVDPLGLSTDGGNPHNHPPWTNPDGSIRWPPDRGFASVQGSTLQPGHQIDRYGGYTDESGRFRDRGTFVADTGTPYEQRALPDGSNQKPYRRYEVVRPIPVQSGPAAPWFGQPGGGTQHELPDSVENLTAQGYLREVH
ncbi:MAG: glycohydrolase toxin TNT-related protein, partial [Polyangiaceae bacterium]|nr:glycohydrolase toxin TNT-related protein [Polyangiaceae bacterium]